MPLTNRTKNLVLDDKVVVCGSLWRQARGLLFRRKQSAVFLFTKPRKVPLHMIGMLYPIDILVLDKQKRVQEIKTDFKPFQFYTPSTKGYYVVEVPSGRLGETAIGDILAFP